MEANAALHTIVPRDTGETYREMLTQMARESGIETPSADWESPIDPDAKVARMKNGATRMAYKPEQAVDLDAGVIVAAPIHPADRGDTNTLDPTLEVAKQNLAGIGLAPTSAKPCVLIADKGHHSRERLKRLDGDVWKTRIAGPKPANGILRWHGDVSAQKAVYANRARLKSGVGREAMRKRGEMVERSFAHSLGRGGMRRAWLRGARKPPQALSRPRRRVQPERSDAHLVRMWHSKGSCRTIPDLPVRRSDRNRAADRRRRRRRR